jgi:hypothetical protein
MARIYSVDGAIVPVTTQLHSPVLEDTSLPSQCTNLPVELWKEIFREASTIDGEFDILEPDGLRFRRFYEYEWMIAFRNRLAIVLVSHLFHDVGIEFLYSSLVVSNNVKSAQFYQLLTHLETTGAARWVKRLRVERRLNDQLDIKQALMVLPRIRTLDTYTSLTKLTKATEYIHLTAVQLGRLNVTAARWLARLPNLCELYFFDVFWKPYASPPITLPHVHTIYVGNTPFNQIIRVPVLRSLILYGYAGPRQLVDTLSRHYLASLSTLGLHTLPNDLPLVPHPAPQLRQVIIREPDFHCDWTSLPKFISFTTVQLLHLPLEAPLSALYTAPLHTYTKDILSSLLTLTYGASSMPSLRRIHTDITFNTVSIVTPPTVTLLKEWEEKMRARGVEVFTGRKKCMGGAREYVPLVEEMQATPNFEFWEAAHSRGQEKWKMLAVATERDRTMKWEVDVLGVQCRWWEL